MADTTQGGTGGKSYEMASAYVAILPSLKGLQGELQAQLNGAMPTLKTALQQGVNSAVKGSASGMSRLFSGLGSATLGIGRSLYSSLSSAISASGRLLSQTLSASAKTIGGALTVAIGAVGGQVVGGGFTRALGINEAEAKLKALGYQGQEFATIMENATKAVDGSRFTLGDSIGAAGQILAAGVKPGKELEGVLENISKLTDMSGTRSYADISSMFGKNAAAGIVQMEDLNQLIDSGIAILPALAKQYGTTALEVRKMASEGKITFADFNKAIQQMTFDSTLYARQSVKAAFTNMRSQMSKIGATLWDPIIDGLGPIINKITDAFRALQKNKGFADFINLVQTRLADLMADVDKFITKFTDAFKDEGKIKKFFTDLVANFTKFKEAIKGIQGPIGGLGVALSSGLLRSLPIVGGLFGRISPAVGLVGGAFYQMYQNSEVLKGAIGTLTEKFKNLLKGFKGGIGAEIFQKLGDALGRGINALMEGTKNINFTAIFGAISEGITDFINTISKHGPKIAAAFDKIVGTFSSVGKQLSGGDSKKFGEMLANGVVKAIEVAATAIEAVVPLVATVIEAVGTIVTSDFTKGIFGALVNLAKWLADHKTVLIALAALFAGGFMIKTIMGPIIAFVLAAGRLIAVYQLISGPATAVLGSTSTRFGLMLVGVFDGLKMAGAAIKAALPDILIGMAGVAAVVLAIGGLTYLLDKMNFFEILGKVLKIAVGLIQQIINVLLDTVQRLVVIIGQVFTMISNAVKTGWSAIEPILNWIRDSWLMVFQTIGNMVLQAIPVITEAIDKFVTTMMGAAEVSVTLLDSMIKSLAENGIAAGAGGVAAAGGIAALAVAIAALGGGSLLHDIAAGLGSLWTSFVEGITGDDVSAISQLTAMADAMKTFDAGVSDMPQRWGAVGSAAYQSGWNIMQNFSAGMTSAIVTMEAAITAALIAMIQRLQAQVSAMPINLQINSGALGSGVNAGSTIYNTNTNYDVNVSNSSVVKSLALSAR